MIVNNLGLIEAGLTFLIVVGFCVWQYVSASRPSAPPRHPEGEHPLDDR